MSGSGGAAACSRTHGAPWRPVRDGGRPPDPPGNLPGGPYRALNRPGAARRDGGPSPSPKENPMSPPAVAPPAVRVAGRRDPRTLRRVPAAVLLPLGPLSVAALRGLLPYFTADDGTQTVRQTAAHLGRQDAVLWLSVLATVALIPSALAAGRLAQRRAPVLSLLGVGLLVPAFTALFLFAGDPTVRALAGSGLDPHTAGGILDAQNDLAPVSVAALLFVAGHIIGMVLLGAALARARAVPA